MLTAMLKVGNFYGPSPDWRRIDFDEETLEITVIDTAGRISQVFKYLDQLPQVDYTIVPATEDDLSSKSSITLHI